MSHYETCACCRKIHSPSRFTAVYIKKRYFCQPSCSNQYWADAKLVTDRFSGGLIASQP